MEDFKYYIGVKMLGAIPMTKGDAFNAGKLDNHPTSIFNSERDQEGYLCYNGIDTCWKPKDEFESAYFPIEDMTKISRNDVTSFIVQGQSTKLGDKTCVVLDSTITGFDIIGTSTCVDPNNYSQEVGEEIARRDIINSIWGHLGFVLQWAKNGLKSKISITSTNSNTLDEPNSNFTEYRRKGNSQMRPFIEGESTDKISISSEDLKLDTLVGGYVARNPKNHNDQWYVAKKYFDDNLEPA